MNLKEMGINVGKMARLTKLAEELSIEPEEGQDEYIVAEAMLEKIDAKDDNEWEAMSADLKEWSNTINSAKKLAKDKKPAKAAAPKAKSKAKPTEEKAPAEEVVAAATKKPAKAAAAPKKAPAPKKEKAVAAPAPKVGKKDLAALKAQAKAKAEAAPKRKFVSDPNGLWRVGTTAWHVMQVLKDAGSDGITMEDAVKEFEKRVKKHKLETSNPAARVATIFGIARRERDLAKKEGKLFRATKRLLQSE